MALRSDGTVVGWSGSAVPDGLSNVVESAAGVGRSLALKEDGSVVVWGGAVAPEELTHATTIAASYWSLAARAYEIPIAWGSVIGIVVLNIPPTFTNMTAVAAGSSHGLALRTDSTVGSWGSSAYGETNVPANLTNVVAIAAGTEHSLALVAEDPAEFAPPALHPVLTTNGYAVSFPTRRGWRYRLEYKESLADARWTMLPPIPGDGTVQIATDPNPIAQQRFYRVRQQQ